MFLISEPAKKRERSEASGVLELRIYENVKLVNLSPLSLHSATVSSNLSKLPLMLLNIPFSIAYSVAFTRALYLQEVGGRMFWWFTRQVRIVVGDLEVEELREVIMAVLWARSEATR